MTAPTIPLADLSNYRSMQAEAKARGLRYVGVSTTDLRASLIEARARASRARASLVEARAAESAPTAPTPAPTEPVSTPTVSTTTVANVAMPFGSFVWYEFIRSKITVADLRSAIAAAGLSVDVADIDETVEVRGCARRWKIGRGNADRFKSEVSHEDDHIVTIGILRREQVSTKKVGWVQVDSLAWDKSSESWISRGYSAEADKFRAFADDRRVYVGHDTVRPILVSLVETLRPIRLRRAGGIWYIPTSPEASDLLPRLEQFVGSIGDSYLSIAEQTTDSARRSTAREVRSGLSEEVASLRAQIDEWKSALRNPRKDAVANVLEAFVDLRDRADLYASALSIRVDGLRSEIAEIESMARGFVRDQSDRKDRKRPSAGLLALLSDLVDQFDPNEDGRRIVPVEALDGTGLPQSMFGSNAQRYWSTNTVGVRALGALGFSVEFVEVVSDDESDPVSSLLILPSESKSEPTSEE